MSSYPTEETLAKVSSDSAQKFVEWYYQDLNESKSLSQYYINSNNKYAAAGLTADITINGAHLANPAEYETLLEAQRGNTTTNNNRATNGGGAAATTRSSSSARGASSSRVRHEVDSFDAQVINDDYTLGAPAHQASQGPDRAGGRVSMLVSVMGILHLGSGHDAARKTFNEVFVLVPNWDARGRNPPRNVKRYLISSQNYRTL